METTQQTIENNKLIAEFMGYKINPSKMIVFDGISGQYFLDRLYYNSSWEWLMTVVEEIEQNKKYFKKELQLNITKYSVCWQTIDNEALILSPNVFHKYGTYAGTEKIQAVYNSVIDFITWYNKNQQNKSKYFIL